MAGGKRFLRLVAAALLFLSLFLFGGCNYTREITEFRADGVTAERKISERVPFGYGSDGKGNVYPSDNVLSAGLMLATTVGAPILREVAKDAIDAQREANAIRAEAKGASKP